jgi:hybrid cluster-associated redox disulfide protein
MDAAPTVHTTIAELIDEWPAARAVLARRGMACVGCAMARFETIKEAARTYGFEAAHHRRVSRGWWRAFSRPPGRYT